MRHLLAALLLSLTPSLAFAQGLPIKDANSSTLVEVGTTSQAIRTELHDSLGTAIGAMATQGGVVAGGGVRPVTGLNGGALNRVQAGIPLPKYYNPVDGATIDSILLVQELTTQTVDQASGYIRLNASAITTINTRSEIASAVTMQHVIDFPTVARWVFRRNNVPQINETVEMGIFNASAAAAPTDGVLFRWNASGEFRAIAVNNSVESPSSALTSPAISTAHSAMIVRRALSTDFYINELLVATITDASNAQPSSTTRLPFSARIVIGGSIPGAVPTLQIGPQVMFREGDFGKPLGDVLAGMGRMASQSPITPFAQTTNHANSTSPASASLSNTAAGYSTLGGRYQFATVASAATDFALFAYQVPTGFQLYVKSVTITSCNTGAAVATTATIMDWGVGYGSTLVSLATTDAFATGVYGPRRVPLGTQAYIVGNGIGVCAPNITQTFDPPLVVDSARFFHVILQLPLSTNTASQVIRGDVVINGYWE